MRKFAALFLTLSLAASLTACGKSGNDDAKTTTAGEEKTTVEETTEAETTAEETTVADEEITTEEEIATEDAVVEVMSHDEYVAAAIDTPVVIETYVQAKQSWWEDKATVYGQSEDGAYFMYDMACSEEDYEKLTVGTKIKVTGYKAEWSGEVEIVDASFEIIEGEEFVAEALDVTKLLGTDELIAHQNEFVSFTGMTVEAAGQDEDGNDVAYLYKWDGSGQDGDDLYFNVSLDGTTYTFTVESYLCDNTTDVYAAVKELEIGDVIDMEGFLYWYEGANPHITSVTAAE